MRYADAHCTYIETHNPHRYTFSGPCQVTGKPFVVTVLAEELWAYRQGAMAQDAFKSLTNAEREFLISGTSPEGWKILFGEPDVDSDGTKAG
jgi:hypothetical protein